MAENAWITIIYLHVHALSYIEVTSAYWTASGQWQDEILVNGIYLLYHLFFKNSH